MNQKYEITLSTVKQLSSTPLLNIMQNDEGTRIIVANLVNEIGEAFIPEDDVTAEFWYEKSDGTGGSCEATISGSTVSTILSEQASTASGQVYATFKLTKSDGNVLSTMPFIYNVTRFPMGKDLDSVSDYLRLKEALDNLDSVLKNGGVTSAQVESMIQKAIGGIENGTY